MKLRLISTEQLVDHMAALTMHMMVSQKARRFHQPNCLFDLPRHPPLDVEALARDVVVALIDDRLQNAMHWTPRGHDNAFMDKAIAKHLPNWSGMYHVDSGSAMFFEQVIDVLETNYMPSNKTMFGFNSTWRECSIIPVGDDLGFVIGEDYRIRDWMERHGAEYGKTYSEEIDSVHEQIDESHGEEIKANVVGELFRQLTVFLGPDRLQQELQRVASGEITMQELLNEMRTWQQTQHASGG